MGTNGTLDSSDKFDMDKNMLTDVIYARTR